MLLLKNCHLVECLTEGVDFSEGDVLLDGGKITTIAPAGTLQIEGAQVMDLAGKTLMPGIIDMHVHLFTTDYTSFGPGISPVEYAYRVMSYSNLMLDLGITTVRDVGDNPSRPAIALSRAIDAGKLPGPNIIPSGPILCPTAPSTSDCIAERIDGRDNTRLMCRRNLVSGAKFIKLYGSASMTAPCKETGYPIIEPEEIEEAVKVAKNYSTYVSIHCHGAKAIDNAVKAGVHTVEHASMITEETLQYIDDNHLDVGVVPTLFVFRDSVAGMEGSNEEMVNRLGKIKADVIASLKNVYQNHKGILMGWGTDVIQTRYAQEPGAEFKLRKEWLECTDEDIIKQATINSAKLMYMDDQIGSVKVGKMADLIVVDSDPSKDITVMYQKPLHVIKSGNLIR